MSKPRRCPKSQSSLRRYFRAGGNPVIQNRRDLSEAITIFPSSFPRKRESRNEKQQEFIGNGWSLKVWIPAFAGMTGF
ncbi:hypothetical protein B2G52_02995 [Neisseria lactamica]|uniref:Uncharacterized protein n=1 Tax=Neisseria lactamica TaxID=486 RepID=A0AAU8VKD5_NEILA|nr:hypothetical protein B2G52_02995 [Neisseria lactamica]